MTGLLRVVKIYFGGYLVTATCAIAVNMFVLCLICAKRPSKTDPYNTANIIAHVANIATLLSSLFLAYSLKGTRDEWITPNVVGFSLTAIQAPFWY